MENKSNNNLNSNNNKSKKEDESLFAKSSERTFAKEMLLKINNGMRFIWLSGSISIFLIIIFDQLTKQLAQYFLKIENHSITAIPYLLDFTLIYNDGAAFGSLSGNRFFLISSSLIMGLAMTLFLLFRYKKLHQVTRVALYMMIGGCFGNFIDRAFYPQGLVVDFIDMPWVFFWTKQSPVFNVADMALVIGVAVLIIGLVVVFSLEHTRSEKRLNSLENNLTAADLNKKLVKKENDEAIKSEETTSNTSIKDVEQKEENKESKQQNLVKTDYKYKKNIRDETVTFSKENLDKLSKELKGENNNGRK